MFSRKAFAVCFFVFKEGGPLTVSETAPEHPHMTAISPNHVGNQPDEVGDQRSCASCRFQLLRRCILIVWLSICEKQLVRPLRLCRLWRWRSLRRFLSFGLSFSLYSSSFVLNLSLCSSMVRIRVRVYSFVCLSPVHPNPRVYLNLHASMTILNGAPLRAGNCWLLWENFLTEVVNILWSLAFRISSFWTIVLRSISLVFSTQQNNCIVHDSHPQVSKIKHQPPTP
jgi:hypothetical protein